MKSPFKYGTVKPIIIEKINAGMTVPQIVKEYGFNRGTVYKTIRILGLTANKRKYTLTPNAR